MSGSGGRLPAALAVAAIVMAAPAIGHALQSDTPTAAQNAAAASEDTEYHQELEAAAASLKADIQAESDASAAAVIESHPSMMGVILAAVIGGVGLIALAILVPVSLRARKRRREMAIDLISGKPRSRRER